MKVEKTILEERLEARAVERFKKDYEKLVDFLINHPIGRHLGIQFGDKVIPLAGMDYQDALLNHRGLRNKHVVYTNLQDVYKKVVEQYIEEETDVLLEKVGALSYLFKQA